MSIPNTPEPGDWVKGKRTRTRHMLQEAGEFPMALCGARLYDIAKDEEKGQCKTCAKALTADDPSIHHEIHEARDAHADAPPPPKPPDAIPTKEEDEAAWLAWRRGGLGGTDVSAILGINPWRSGWDVWLDKTGQGEPFEGNEATEFGNIAEDMVIRWGARQLNAAVVRVLPQVHRKHPVIRGSADSLLAMEAGGMVGLEAKTTKDEPDGWEPTLIYKFQCRVYMAVYDHDVWWLAAFHKHHAKFTLHRIDRDLAIEEAMIEKMLAWWQTHIVEGKPPVSDGSKAEHTYLRDTHQQARPGFVQASDEMEKILHRYADLSKAKKRIDAEQKQLGAQIKRAIGDAGGIIGSAGKMNWSRYDRTNTNLKQLRLDHPDIAEKYTTKTPAERLQLMPHKGNK